MAHETSLKHVFYVVATPEKVWEGFVSPDKVRRLRKDGHRFSRFNGRE
jgi:hypothetical protein